MNQCFKMTVRREQGRITTQVTIEEFPVQGFQYETAGGSYRLDTIGLKLTSKEETQLWAIALSNGD